MALIGTRDQVGATGRRKWDTRRDVAEGHLPDFLLDDDYRDDARVARLWARLSMVVAPGLAFCAAVVHRLWLLSALPAGSSSRHAVAPAANLVRLHQADRDAQALRSSPSYENAKRLLDVIGSAVGLVVLTPLFAVVAWLIKREDGGPIIHQREVVGLGGRMIRAYKFRTMVVNADEYLKQRPALLAEYAANMKLRRDPRITRIGAVLRRTSLDELPQLVNVLRGEMSLVGPRMIHPSERARYGDCAYLRQCVRPGITGLWQVSGRQEVSYSERIELDRAYLRQRSFWFDLTILARTVGVLLRRYGAY